MKIPEAKILASARDLIALGLMLKTVQALCDDEAYNRELNEAEAKAEAENIRGEAENLASNVDIDLPRWFVFSFAGFSIVDAIRENIKRAKGEIIDAHRDRNLSIYDRKRQLDITTRDLCWSIKQVEKHNGGVLPDDLAKDWTANTCHRFNIQ